MLFGVRANFPESIRGLRLWGLAPLCASSTVLFVLHGVLPAWSLVLGGNGLLMAGFACFLFVASALRACLCRGGFGGP